MAVERVGQGRLEVYIVESGAFLYQEDLATHIKELFADVLQPLEASEEREEAVQASDDEAPH